MREENEYIEIEFHSIEEKKYNAIFVKKLYEKINAERKDILYKLNIENARKVKINLYDNKEMFLNDIASFYNEYEIPDYCRGTIQKGEIFFLVNTKLDANNFIYELELRKIVHEYIHILYAEYIANINERITWLDEGIALNLSKEKGKFIKERFPILKSNIKEIDLNELKHENGTFVTENINGYDVSFLTVKYLIETLSRDDFNKIIRNHQEIIKIRKKHLDKCNELF